MSMRGAVAQKWRQRMVTAQWVVLAGVRNQWSHDEGRSGKDCCGERSREFIITILCKTPCWLDRYSGIRA